MAHGTLDMVDAIVSFEMEQIWNETSSSLFFFRFSESSARSREWQSRETRETREAAISLNSLTPSLKRVAICVSRALLDGLQKKERLLVV